MIVESVLGSSIWNSRRQVTSLVVSEKTDEENGKVVEVVVADGDTIAWPPVGGEWEVLSVESRFFERNQ